MFPTIEPEVGESGQIRPKEPLILAPGTRVLVTVLDCAASEPALLNETSLAEDWHRPEEDAAWSHLPQG
jgi:hypothetical protein